MTVPRVTPTSSPIIPRKDGIELILFTGYPGTGKTTFYERNFKPSGYKHVNQDTLGNRTKCLKAVEEFLRKGTSCVVGELSTGLTWFNALRGDAQITRTGISKLVNIISTSQRP